MRSTRRPTAWPVSCASVNEPARPDHLELLLLADEDVVRAAVAWTRLPRYVAGIDGAVQWADGSWYSPEVWMVAAGLPTHRHGEMVTRLRTLGFITTSGDVWPPLLAAAEHLASRKFTK